MLELLVISIMMFGSGTAVGWYATPVKVCKEIQVSIPEKYLTTYNTTDCLEDIEAGLTKTCEIPMPRYVLSEQEYMDYDIYVKSMRVHLDECRKVVNIYNLDKFNEY